MFGCDLLSTRRKFLVTSSPILSAKLIERETHFGVEAHSVVTLAHTLYKHPAISLGGQALRRLSSEEREFLGEELREALSPANYFKKAFELPGLRACVFHCLEELRLAGYQSKNLVDKSNKMTSLREVFELYLAGLARHRVFDYPRLLEAVVGQLQKKEYAEILKKIDVIIPFELDLSGMESSFMAVLREYAAIYEHQEQSTNYLSDTDPTAKSLAQFKNALRAFLDREPLSAPAGPQSLDASLKLQASLTPEESIAEVFQWLSDRNAQLDTAALVTPDYDYYAGALYRFCKKHKLPLNLSQGMHASEFEFFAQDIAALDEIEKKHPGADEFILKIARYFKIRKCDESAYEAFRGQALGFIQRYKEAKKTTTAKGIPEDHFSKMLKETLLESRLNIAALDLDRQGLYFGVPEDLLGVKLKHLAIIGLQDHRYPPKIVPDPILTDLEREEMNEKIESGKFIHELATSAPKLSEKDCLEKIVLGVENSLFLGIQSHDLSTGTLSLPSSFFNRVLGAFGFPQKAEEIQRLCNIRSEFIPKAGKSLFYDYDLYLAADNKVGPRDLVYQESTHRSHSPKVNEEDIIHLGASAAGILDKAYSSSGLTDFFSCPYRFYLKYINGIRAPEGTKENPLAWLDHLQRGEFLHSVFCELTQSFIDSHTKTYGAKEWLKYLEKEAPALVDPALAKSSLEYEESKIGVPQTVISQELQSMRVQTLSFIEKEKKQVKETGFFPLKAEEEFGDLKYEALVGKNKISLNFSGQVDRVDSNGQGEHRVIDYKTGTNHYKDEDNLFIDGGDYIHFQHAVYGHWAVKNTELGIKDDKLSSGYYFCSDKGDWKTIVQPYLSFTSRMEKAMAIFHAALKAGEFSKNSKGCNGCTHAVICGGVSETRKPYAESSPQLFAIAETLQAPVVEDK